MADAWAWHTQVRKATEPSVVAFRLSEQRTVAFMVAAFQTAAPRFAGTLPCG